MGTFEFEVKFASLISSWVIKTSAMPAGDSNMEYSIGTINRFAGISSDLDEDPIELIRNAQAKPKKDKDLKKSANKDAKKNTKGVKKEEPVVEEAKQEPARGERGGRGGRGRGCGRGGERGGRGRGGFSGPRRENNNNEEGGTETRAFRDQDDNKFGSGGFGSGGFGGDNSETERRAGRGGFRGRGRGSGRGGRGREFDRRSGVKAVDKKDGHGSSNWGTPEDDLAAQTNNTEATTEEKTDAADAETEDAPTDTVQEVVEETKEMSLDEWKASQARERPQFNLRKANEGEKGNTAKGLKQIKKLTEEENEEDGSLFFPRTIYQENLKTSGRVKESLDVNIQFSSGDNRHIETGLGRGRGGRGGRGRGGNRGGRRDEEPASTASADLVLNLENDSDFPSLMG